MSEKEEKNYHFIGGNEINKEQLKGVKATKQVINTLLEISGLDQDLCMTVLFELIEQDCMRIYDDRPQLERYVPMKELFCDWVDEKTRRLKEDLEKFKHTHEYRMECTLCGNVNEHGGRVANSLGVVVFPIKVTRVETEGCPICYKGKGEIITHVTLYDKDNNILANHTKEQLYNWSVEEAQEAMRKL